MKRWFVIVFCLSSFMKIQAQPVDPITAGLVLVLGNDVKKEIELLIGGIQGARGAAAVAQVPSDKKSGGAASGGWFSSTPLLDFEVKSDVPNPPGVHNTAHAKAQNGPGNKIVFAVGGNAYGADA